MKKGLRRRWPVVDMARRRRVHRVGLVVALAGFTALSLLLTTVVIASLLDLDTASTRTYRAAFVDASFLQSGAPVRIAGVEVGRVRKVAVHGTGALVTFSLASSQRLTTTSEAQIEYDNLFGQRNLTLTAGAGGSPLPSGATIPVDRTQPALDLTELFNGFQPLFQALTPSQINQLTGNIIGAFQGQRTNVTALVNETAELTTNLAGNRSLIDKVVDNLDQLLGTVSSHDAQVGAFIDQFDTLATNLASERGLLGSSLSSAATLTTSLSNLLAQARPPLQTSIANLIGVTGNLARNTQVLDALTHTTPVALTDVSDTLQDGGFANVDICNLHLTIPYPLPFTPFQLPSSLDTLLGSVGNVLNALYPTNGSAGALATGHINIPQGYEGNPADLPPTCR